MPSGLTPEVRRWLGARARLAVLATSRADGTVSQSVMWALLEPDDTVLMNTRADRAKARELIADPRASLCFAEDYRYVTIEGSVTVRPGPDNRDIERLRTAYGVEKDFSPQLGERVSLILTVERVLVHLRRLP